MIFTLNESAEKLRISRRTLGRLIAEGAIPAIHLSTRRIGIDSADLDSYVGGRKCLSGGIRTKAVFVSASNDADKWLEEFCRKGQRDSKLNKSTSKSSENLSTLPS